MKRSIDRILDIIISLTFLFFTWPLILVLSLTNLFMLGRPIFFLQKRVGYKEKIFNIIKLRTMKTPSAFASSDEERVTPYGLFLRKYSLDELPTLLNVLKGDMRVVGPRPLLPEYLDVYTEEQKKRHNVPPGVTGWAQVNGRNAISWEEKFDMDVWYVNNHNLWIDLKILFKTVVILIKAKDISHKGHVSMPKFEKLDN